MADRDAIDVKAKAQKEGLKNIQDEKTIQEEINKVLAHQTTRYKEVNQLVEHINNLLGTRLKTDQDEMTIREKIVEWAKEQTRETKNMLDLEDKMKVAHETLSKLYQDDYKRLLEIEDLFGMTTKHVTEQGSITGRMVMWGERFNRYLEQRQRGTGIVTDHLGKQHRYMTLADRAITSMLGGMQNLIKYLMPTGMFFGGILGALIAIGDKLMKGYAMAQQFAMGLGVANRITTMFSNNMASVVDFAGSLTRSVGDVAAYLRIETTEARKLLQLFQETGAVAIGNVRNMDELGIEMEKLAGRAKAFHSMQAATGIETERMLGIVHRLRIGYGENLSEVQEISGNQDLLVNQADLFSMELAEVARQAQAFGFQAKDVYNVFTELLTEADRLNINYRQAVVVYKSLLELKEKDVQNMYGLRDLSEEGLKNISMTATKLVGASLSTKAMVSAFAGMPFKSLMELVGGFENPAKAFERMRRAAEAPLRILIRDPERLKEIQQRAQKDEQFRNNLHRVIYGLFEDFYSQIGLTFEETSAIFSGSEKAMKEIEKKMKEQFEMTKKARPDVEQTLKIGSSIAKNLQGVSGIVSWFMGKIATLVGTVERIAAKYLGAKPPEEIMASTTKEFGKVLTVAQKIPQATTQQLRGYRETEIKVLIGSIMGQLEQLTAEERAQVLAEFGEMAKKAGLTGEVEFKITADVAADPERVKEYLKSWQEKLINNYKKSLSTETGAKAPPVNLLEIGGGYTPAMGGFTPARPK